MAARKKEIQEELRAEDEGTAGGSRKSAAKTTMVMAAATTTKRGERFDLQKFYKQARKDGIDIGHSKRFRAVVAEQTPGPGAYSFSLAATSSNHSPTARCVSSSSFRSLSAQRPKPERSGDPGAYDPQHPKTVAASSRSYLQRLSASQRSRTRSGDESEPWPARPSLWMGEEAAYCA